MNYFVEGIQGSGKSTLVGQLSDLRPEYKAIREGEKIYGVDQEM